VERPALEVADIFRDFGPAWRDANRGHISHAQLKVMSAIEACRTAALGGYVARCENEECAHTAIAFCSCRNRHCPKCQGSQALAWMEERKAELLQIPYFHIVFTLPAEIGAIAYQNKAVIYALLFKAASDTMLTIAGDPKHLGAKVGITAVLHTWGSALTHHPHVHMIVTGGGISPDGSRWIASRPDYLVPVEVLSALFRGRMLGMLSKAHTGGRLKFFGDYEHLADTAAFKTYLAPLWKTDWFVYAKRPFAGPEQVLAYLSRYTHRVAISNSRLISADASGVTFKYKDYRIEGPDRYTTMTLEPGEFIRRFLMHVLPKGFHRIRHYGLLANDGDTRAEKIARARQLIAKTAQVNPARTPPQTKTCEHTTRPEKFEHSCPHCGGRMVIVETFEAPRSPPHPRSAPVSMLTINTS
jgi:Putative transposase/Transposase zinc-binding domain